MKEKIFNLFFYVITLAGIISSSIEHDNLMLGGCIIANYLVCYKYNKGEGK